MITFAAIFLCFSFICRSLIVVVVFNAQLYKCYCITDNIVVVVFLLNTTFREMAHSGH